MRMLIEDHYLFRNRIIINAIEDEDLDILLYLFYRKLSILDIDVVAELTYSPNSLLIRNFFYKLNFEDKRKVMLRIPLIIPIKLARKETGWNMELIDLYFMNLPPNVSISDICDINQGIEEAKKSQDKDLIYITGDNLNRLKDKYPKFRDILKEHLENNKLI